jgi:uroporphyrinogen-III synthase
VRVAVTASLGRLETLEARLAAAGFEAVRAPLVATRPLPAAHAEAHALIGLPWRLYPSRSAVLAWTGLGLGLIDGARLGAVGPGTAAELVRAGARADAVGQPATASGLVRAVLAHPAAPRPGDTVAVVQGDRARPTLVAALRAGGVEARVATLYASRASGWDLADAVDAVVLASPTAVAQLPARVAARAQLVAIGPTTAAAVADRGWDALVAEAPTEAGVVAALERWRAAASAAPAAPSEAPAAPSEADPGHAGGGVDGP